MRTGGDPASRIHLVCPFRNRGGSQERALGIHELLREHASVQVWSSTRINPHYAGRGCRRIWTALGIFPRGGTIVFVGTSSVGAWVQLSFPSRVVIIHNTWGASSLLRSLRKLRSPLLPRTEVVYCSPGVARIAGIPGIPGIVQLSPIDLERFRPSARAPGQPFTVGRLSRDDLDKYGPHDPQLFRTLGAEGIRVRLMGASCIAAELTGAPGVEIIPFGAEPADAFLGSLDCFLYRTADHWPEPHGRVVSEAMACSIPPVCHRSGGYADYLVDHGRTGFLFETDEEAAAIVRMLRDDPALRARIGAEARRRVEVMIGPEGVQTIRDFYLGTAHPTPSPAPAR